MAETPKTINQVREKQGLPPLEDSRVGKVLAEATLDELNELSKAGEQEVDTPTQPKLEVNDAPLTKKQQEKAEKKAKEYWGTMISRGEAFQMVKEALETQDNKLRLLMVQVQTLGKLVQDKGLATEDELNELSKPIIADLYGIPEDKLAELMKEDDTNEEPVG